MASLNVSGSPSTTTNTVTVNFTTDVSNVSKVELSNNGGSTYISATSSTSTSAVFNVASWSNGTYDNCILRLTYTESSSGGTEPDPGGGTTPGGGTEPGDTTTNLLEGKTLINAYFNNNTGEIGTSGVSTDTGAVQDYIPVTGASTYTFNCNMNGATIQHFRYGWYDSNKTYMSYNTIEYPTPPFNFAIPEGASYIRFHIVTDTGHTYSAITDMSLKFHASGETDITSNILTGLIRGYAWNGDTSSVGENPLCWATVDRISVTPNKTYRIICNASWLWVRAYDSSDSLTATLSTGADTNPSEFTFTATTPYIRCGCYDPDNTLAYFKLIEV